MDERSICLLHLKKNILVLSRMVPFSDSEGSDHLPHADLSRLQAVVQNSVQGSDPDARHPSDPAKWIHPYHNNKRNSHCNHDSLLLPCHCCYITFHLIYILNILPSISPVFHKSSSCIITKMQRFSKGQIYRQTPPAHCLSQLKQRTFSFSSTITTFLYTHTRNGYPLSCNIFHLDNPAAFPDISYRLPPVDTTVVSIPLENQIVSD